MAASSRLYGLLSSIFGLFVEVIHFWQRRLSSWWSRKSPRDALLEHLAEARLFEEYEAACFQLDALLGNDLWRQNPTSKFYDYRLIYGRLQAIINARDDADMLSLVNLLRSGLVRNLGNITSPRLFTRAYAGTKLLIEDYITQVALAIEHVTTYPTTAEGLTSQAKLDLLHDTRQAFGRSALVLQGGAIFGLCHIGVVKALHLRGLLPRIICGTSTGALIAALVGVHAEDELLGFLTGDKIDLSAFAGKLSNPRSEGVSFSNGAGYLSTLIRRVKRFIKQGYFLDVKVLEECVRANVGNLTFEEAYQKTKRVLNITIPADPEAGVPSLLNYLTAPNVLIWSAAVASNAASSSALYSPVTIYCKDPGGHVLPWSSASFGTAPSSPTNTRPWTIPQPSHRRHSRAASLDLHSSPLSRVAELFNVNHFVVSQARPYIAPWLQNGDLISQSTMHATISKPAPLRRDIFSLVSRALQPIFRITLLELQHRLRQLDNLDLLPLEIRRFLVDDHVPGTSLTLVPELSPSDFVRLLERPTKQRVNEWIIRGERSVWPAVSTLKIRCAIEVELDRGYQLVRRRKPMDVVFVVPGGTASQATSSNETLASSSSAAAAAEEGRKGDDGVLMMQSHGPHLRGPGEKRRKRHRHERSSSQIAKRLGLEPLQTALSPTKT